MPIRRKYGLFPLDFGNTSNVRDVGICVKIQLCFYYESTTSANYDSVSTRVPQILDAKSKNQSNFQVRDIIIAYNFHLI